MSVIRMSTRSRVEHFERAGAVLGDEHVVAVAPQDDRQQFAHRALIVDHEDARRRLRLATASPVWSSVVMFNSTPAAHSVAPGSVTSTWVPTPRCDVTCTAPP